MVKDALKSRKRAKHNVIMEDERQKLHATNALKKRELEVLIKSQKNNNISELYIIIVLAKCLSLHGAYINILLN